jgi:uncharacterized protein (DUF1800 family)
LLRRAVFGVLPSELESVVDLGMNGAVTQLIQSSPARPPPVNDYNNYQNSGFEDVTVAAGETWVKAIYDGDAEGLYITSLKGWLVENIVNQEMTMHEKMLPFWYKLLVTQSWDVFASKISYEYFTLLREDAFGNYKALVKLITLDPAVLLFLNGAFNIKDAPDENYGRELQELCCIGKGVDSNYSEEDVRAASRVLTGWTLRGEDFDTEGEVVSVFYPPYHDTSGKQFSSFYNSRVIVGREGVAGMEEVDELIDMLFENMETAKYICRRLYTFFVYHEIDAVIESTIITPLAKIFRNNNYEVKAVLETIFKSAHFYEASQYGAMIKSPVEYHFSIYRTLRYSYPTTKVQTKLYRHLTMLWYISAIGMEIGYPLSVAGWPAYYQAPQFDKSWITSDSISKRAEISDAMTVWGVYLTEDEFIPVDMISCAKSLSQPADPNALITSLAELFYGIPITTEIRDELK